MRVRDIIRLLEQDGWYLKASKGSHRQYKHPTKSGRRLERLRSRSTGSGHHGLD